MLLAQLTGEPWERGPPRHTLSSSRELLHLAHVARGRMLFCSRITCEKGNFKKSVSAYQSLLSSGCFAALSTERSSRGTALSSQDPHVGRGVVLNHIPRTKAKVTKIRTLAYWNKSVAYRLSSLLLSLTKRGPDLFSFQMRTPPRSTLY